MDRILVPVASLLVGVFVFAQWAWLPDIVASRFDAAGQPVGFMGRGVYVAIMVLASSGLPLLIWGTMVRMTQHGRINLPNAEHWLAEPRRQATLRFLRRHAATLSIVLCAFMGYVNWLVAAANQTARAQAGSLVGFHLGVAVAAFLAFAVAWVVVLFVRFGRRR
jgi:hypothetical protein